MHIITEPKVTLIARQEFIYPEHIRWESDSSVPAEILAEFAGRLCYLSYSEDCGIEGHKTIKGRSTNEEYLDNILKVKHGSVTEHAVWSVLVEGVSRSLTHELVRHRAGMAYSQLSQRYVDESDIAFVLPPELLDDYEALRSKASAKGFDHVPFLGDGDTAVDTWASACGVTLHDYRRLLEILTEKLEDTDEKATMQKKRARQTARSVLPNCAETKIVVTGNARAWRHFVEMRASEGADMEIRRLAVAVLRMLQTESPNLFGDMRIVQHTDGSEIATTEYSKV